MLVDKAGRLYPGEKDKKFSMPHADYYLLGFLYVDGCLSGKMSLEFIEESYMTTGEIVFDKIKGAYSICIKRDNGTVYYFSSNSNMSVIYYSREAVSNGLFEIRNYYYSKGVSLKPDIQSVCSYYTIGNVYFDRTFFSEIRILNSYHYMKWENGKRKILDKKIGSIDKKDIDTDPSSFFANFSNAISNENVAMALTGGYDSRLIFSYLYDKHRLTPFFVSDVKQSKEEQIASKVAWSVGYSLKHVCIDKPVLTNELVRNTIMRSDGNSMMGLKEAYVREQYEDKFIKEGISLNISGDGGVLHKDWEWMQELPFYHKSKTDIRRYYKDRIAFQCDASYIGTCLKSIYDQQEETFLIKIGKYVKRINTQSLDMLYYHVNGNRAVYYNGLQHIGLNVYAPLSEQSIVRYSYHLPRWERFFYNSIRKQITLNSETLSKIPTNYGTTASSESVLLLKDVFLQGVEYAKKALRLFGRKVLKKTFFVENLSAWDFKQDLSGLTLSNQALAWAKDNKFVNEGVTVDRLDYGHLERIVIMYVILSDGNIQ